MLLNKGNMRNKGFELASFTSVLSQGPGQVRLEYDGMRQDIIDKVRLGQDGQVGLGWVRLGQDGLGQVRLGQVTIGQVSIGQVS